MDFEPLLNFINNGEFSSGSTSQLQSMYIMPTESTLLFGDEIYKYRRFLLYAY